MHAVQDFSGAVRAGLSLRQNSFRSLTGPQSWQKRSHKYGETQLLF
jgi:hypothetical protein